MLLITSGSIGLFLKAAEADPDMAMAYWGMALALGTNINLEITPQRAKKAYDLIQKGEMLMPHSSEAEQDYIQALAQRYSNDPKTDGMHLAQKYSQAMKLLSKKYPDDLDASAIFAESILNLNPWNQWGIDGKPQEMTMEAVRKLESVLSKNPEHLGANHYYVHAIEASPHPERALLSAERLAKLLPSSGHIVHMPAHIFLLVGDYHQAALSNESAVIADREYIREYGMQGLYPLHYLSHNMYFLTRAYALEGRFTDAKRAASELEAFYAPHFNHMPDLEYYASAVVLVLLKFNKWQEILDLPQPNEKMLMTTIMWHFARAMAFAWLGDLPQAMKERSLFMEGKAELPTGYPYGYNKADKIIKIAEYTLDAKLAEAQKDPVKAVDLLRKATEEQDTLHYNEPPDWFTHIRENLGRVYLRNKQPYEAELVFRQDLKKHPRNGRSLFGLRESLKAQDKLYDAYWVNQAFQKAWLYSDVQLKIDTL